MMERFETIEGNLKAVKEHELFGDPNLWNLYVLTQIGTWDQVQLMGVHRIQKFFTTKLPVYEEVSGSKFKKV
jgi:hypothetical protein